MTAQPKKRAVGPARIRQHVDGPYVEFRDGTVHWLTPKERAAVALGATSAAKLQAKHRPDLAG